MALWVIWLIIAVVLAVAEAFTLTAALGLLGGAALITSGAAALGLPRAPAAAGVRHGRGRRRRGPPAHRRAAHAAAAAGAVRGGRARRSDRPTSCDEVTGRAGTVRIGGEEWTARALDEGLVIPAGAAVDVIQIDGATAVVYPRE